jgi:hypothetical protein
LHIKYKNVFQHMNLKNRLPIVSSLLILFSCVTLAGASSVSAALLKLSPSSGEISDSTQIQVIVDAEGATVDSAVAVVTFNTNHVEITNIADGTYFDSVTTDTTTSGEVAITGTLNISNVEGKTGSGTLATLTVKPKITTGTITLGFRCSAADIDDSNIMNTDGTNLLATDEQCADNVGGSYTVSASSGESTTTPTPTPAETKGEQPALPEELPESGFKDLLKWITSGLALIGIGLLLL